ncbi:MAG: hypothetical protein IJN62_00050 [Clostridia bacterium]|nr:hypothetical protein [Clostridia bacterium]
MKNIFKSAASVVMIILLIIYPDTVVNSALGALSTCINVLFPTLFPFFVLSKIFIKSGGAFMLGKFLNPLMSPIFGINGSGASAFILGVICGYPVGAKTAVDLYNQSYITKKEAENLICFCNNSGPLFIIGALGIGMLSSKSAGVFLYAVHILSAITLGIVLKFTLPTTNKQQPLTYQNTNKNIFTSSVEESMVSVINVFAYVIFFGIMMDICEIAHLFLPAEKLLSDFSINSDVGNSLICSVFEMTTGIKKLSATNNALSLKLILISFMLGWSGVSIHFQTKSVLANTDFSFLKYIAAKFAQGIIAAIYAAIGTNIVSFEKSVFINSSYKLPDIMHLPLHHFVVTVIITGVYITIQRRSDYNKRY